MIGRNSRLDMLIFNYAQITLLLKELRKMGESERKKLNRTLHDSFFVMNNSLRLNEKKKIIFLMNKWSMLGHTREN